MGLVENKPKKIFLNIVNSRWAMRAKAGSENAVERELTKGPNKGKVVHERYFDSVTGFITEVKTHKHESMGTSVIITLQEADEQFELSIPMNSGYANSFFNCIKNVSMQEEIELEPITRKEKSYLQLFQGGEWVEPFYTKDNPGDMPQLEKVTKDGEDVWDSTNRIQFCLDMIDTYIMPGIKGQVETPAIAGKTKPADLGTEAGADIANTDVPDNTTEKPHDKDDTGAPDSTVKQPPGTADDLPF